MKCLYPKTIVRPGLVDRPMLHVPGSREYAKDFLVVPCGKCSACRSSRQDNFACRIRAEADSKGSMALVTLTYNDDSLPLTSTVWRVDKDSGEMIRCTDPDFVCYSRKDDYFGYRQEMSQIKPQRFPRFIDEVFYEDDEFQYMYRITPSVCRADVQLWLKRVRVHFERKLNRHLEFSYAICSEFGPRTCRPHYHCIFFGLSEMDVKTVASLWTFGFTDVRVIPRLNPDGSDAFGKVSEYVGKYVSKGVFECDSVKCGCASSTRMMTSRQLGSQLVDKVRDYVCGFDIVGAPFDLDTFFCPSKNRYLNRDELSKLCSSIPCRLSVSFDGKRYFALPRVIRNKIFYVEKFATFTCNKYSRPSRLWKMVTDSIRNQYAELHQQEFRLFLSGFSPGEVRKAVASFEMVQLSASAVTDGIGDQNYKSKLSKSRF